MRTYFIIFYLLICIFPLNINSQPPGVESVQERFQKGHTYEISANYEYGFDADLDGGGKFDINRFSISGDYKKDLNRKLNFTLDTSYNLTDYNFSGENGLAGLNPWNKIHRAVVGFRLNYQISRKWGIGAGPFVRFSGESGADFGDSLTYGGTVGFLYTPNRNFFAGAGVFVSSRIEDNVLVVPGLLFNWQVNEKLRLSSLLTGVRTELGPRVQLAYDIGNGFSTGFSVGYEFQRFRLDDDGVAIDGVGDIKVLPVWGSLYYDINRMLRLAFYSGVGFLGEIELEDNDGNRIIKDDFDPLVFVGGGIKISL